MRTLAMRPWLLAINNDVSFSPLLQHICRLGDNDLVNNGMDYSGVDALGASLATNGRLRVLWCAVPIVATCVWALAPTLCVPS